MNYYLYTNFEKILKKIYTLKFEKKIWKKIYTLKFGKKILEKYIL